MAESKTLGILNGFTEYINKYGVLQSLCNVAIIIIMCMGLYIAANPEVLFERYNTYIEKNHNASTEYRIQSAPMIRSYLNQLVLETGADRAYIAEYHNGKNNPSGLQWQYADMTFINDAADDVRDEYQNVSLVKYNLSSELNKRGCFVGTVDEISKIDNRIALRLQANDVQSVGAAMMYGENLAEIGFVGISFTDDCKLTEDEISKILYKYSAKISPYLDWSKGKKKKE